MPPLSNIPLGHLDITGVSPPPTSLYACCLQGSGPEGDRLPPTHEQLQYLGVVQTLHCFPVYMGDQVSRPKTSIEGWGPLIHLHNQVMNCVEICVTKIHSDSTDCETKPSGSSSDYNGRLKRVNQR